MRVLSIASLVFFIATSATAQAPAVSGRWDAEMTWANGITSTGNCTLQQDGTNVRAICDGMEQSPANGTLDGRALTLRFDIPNQGAMIWKATLNDAGTAGTGSCEVVGGMSGRLVLRRR